MAGAPDSAAVTGTRESAEPTGVRESAFAKVNLSLFLGPLRADRRHWLVTLFESVCLADELVITPLASGADQVVCPGVSGPNLVSAALAGLRGAGWSAPPVLVRIEKRIPVAAGMGGGSADAAAMLRCARRLGSVPRAAVERIAAGLGADVPGQLDPGLSLGTGAGERIAPVGDLAEHRLLVLPQPLGLSTPEVFREADRLRLPRSARELESLQAELEAALAPGGGGAVRLPERLLVNDLAPAAISLRPEVGAALELARAAGAEPALVCGSGPTVIGIFSGPDSSRRAHRAADQLRGRYPAALAVDAVLGGVPTPAPNESPFTRP